MDVASYMAAMTPVATIAVLPLALLHGDMLSITAHGLVVFAQSTIPIGTIGTA